MRRQQWTLMFVLVSAALACAQEDTCNITLACSAR
jgi:hypothetical protein